MSNRRIFMLLIPGTMAAQNDQSVTNYIKAQEVDWWHWIADVWIVIDPHDRSAIWWRDQLRTFFGAQYAVNLAVFELADASWGAVLPAPALAWLQSWLGGSVDIQRPLQPPSK